MSMNKKDIKPQTVKFKTKDEDLHLYDGYTPYRNQFRPWVAHEDAILIMDSEDDPDFINKLFISTWTNNLISDMSGITLIQSNY